VQVNLDDGSVTGPGGLLERFAQLPDPRGRRGRRHPLAGLLVIAAAAVLAGARSFAAIGQYSHTLPQATLARLGSWQRPYSTWHVAPSETTLRCVLQRVDADELDRVVGSWLAEQAAAGRGPIAVDGKVLRGARQPGGHQVHLFAALAHDSGTILAQRRVDPQTNETTQLEPLLEQVDVAGRLVTADALHTNPAEARWLVERGADYVLTVKGNQPGLVAAIDRLTPEVVSPVHQTVDRGHGRIERRTIQTAPVPGMVRFPGARQVLVLTRQVTALDGSRPRTEVCYGITSLGAERADPARLGVLVRGHWQIESLHWVRDVTFDEDRSQVRTASGPQVMACLRNLAISLLRLAGEGNIAAGLRSTGWDHSRGFALLGS
jgi:predicted transposase YbfD/YdcC